MAVGHVLVLAALAAVTPATNYIQQTFSDSTNNGNFNNLVTDRNSGKLYIGAENKIYQLSDTLVQEKSVTTGPQNDNPNCPPQGECTCSSNCEDYIRRPTDSISKGLTIDYTGNRLIACTNLFQGHCEKRHLEDISEMDDPIFKPLVPNDQTSPVVMFIAPGPPDAEENSVLYIGATRSTEGLNIYKDLVPAFSSRNLNTFELAHSDVVAATKKEVEYQHRGTFRVYYVHGFTSGKFSYILTVQKQSLNSGSVTNYVTKMARVCHNDRNYYSYTEVPLECTHTGASYNILRAAYVGRPGADLARSLGLSHVPPITDREDVLFAVFSKSEPSSPEPVADSVMCVYSLKDIRRLFTTTIQECFSGIGNTGPAHIVSPHPCINTDFQIGDDYCGTYDFNTPIAGTKKLLKEGVIRFQDTSTTAIAVSVTTDYTVAFIGTNTGKIKKVVIESASSATDYEDLTVEAGSPVNMDLVFDRSTTHIYAMTGKKVHRIKVQECKQYKDCNACLGAKDPYCGWCVLENKCTLKGECSNADSPKRWLPYSNPQCTQITRVLPEQVQIRPTKSSELTLMIQNLPSLTEGDYQCAFSGYGIIRTTTARVVVSANSDDNQDITQIQCETPYPNLLPAIPTGKDHIVMQLSVRMDSKDFVSKNFTFFDCNLHNSCTSCTESLFPCTWCVQNHVCTQDRESCFSDTLITGKNVKGTSDRPGPQSCPRIEASFTEILVPSGTDTQVDVKAVNLQSFQTDFKCHFDIDGGKMVNAVKDNEFIKCDSVHFHYSGNSPHRNVPFKIMWGSTPPNPLDNPDKIQVKVYKCSQKALDCGSCLTLKQKYNCGWCDGDCSIEKQCDTTTKTWLDHSQDCPNPSISGFSPLAGPRQGGTRLTIRGVNLGKIFEDIKDGVMVADEPCTPDKDDYDPAKKIVCVTGESSKVKSGMVVVSVRNRFRGTSRQHFSYVNPEITDIYPRKGPQSGGTRLTISGVQMNAGTSISSTVVGLPCNVIQKSAESVVCVTAHNPVISKGVVEMRFDRATIPFNARQFNYVEDPSILSVHPDKTIISGGLKVTVTGTNLDAVREPKMYINRGGVEYISECKVTSSKLMVCRTPNISGSADPHGDLDTDLEASEPLTISYGFLMDNVTELRNLTAISSERVFTVYQDPIFFPFDSGEKYYQPKNEYLTINGKNLNLVLTKDDVIVKVDEAFCNVTSIAEEQLTCRPPGPSAEGVSSNPKVMVNVGNLTFGIGKLRYETPVGVLSFTAILGIGAGGGVLLLIIVIIFIAYRKKSQENDRVMKHMQNQMDILEAKVAKECKEAFAELQTDMTELTSDLSGHVGIPFRDYRSFSMRVLFPNSVEDEHPVTRPFEQVDLTRRDNIERGLRMFNASLIHNKTFLLLFIRTLESHPEFTMREKVNVASLISVALQNRMEYHTDILKTLLGELIEKAMEGRSHPKLLLRRTESVAEKMLTNWFTFLLYKFLKECAGEPLFMLYRAIKQQVDKGPVDALTSEAKYSLSEDKLIRQQIEYKTMTIYVIDPDIQYGTQEHAVKVLDCDTISQVKDKILDAIYKNAPASSRPDKEDLDLEWRTGVKGRLVLQDEDLTTKPESDYKRLNTLAHYKVPDGAVMALMPKQSSMYNLSLGSDKSGSHHRFDLYGMSGSPSLNRSLSPHGIHLDLENGTKYYHLVKQHDLDDRHKEGERGSKMVSEIYLTRLLATKGTLQQFVDDLFETIFSTAHRGCVLPLAIKYMFDFLDDQAIHHGINDPEVVHTWKSNSLPLRFWVNVVKNPDFVFDIHKSNIVDSCLSVVAQTFMDSCSMSDHRLGKDSPSSKLLYAKDIPKYKKWVERYYQDIKLMPAISDQDMNAMLAEESRVHTTEYNTNAALYELYQYVARYNDELMATLEEDEFARNYRLAYKLEQVHNSMDSEV